MAAGLAEMASCKVCPVGFPVESTMSDGKSGSQDISHDSPIHVSVEWFFLNRAWMSCPAHGVRERGVKLSGARSNGNNFMSGVVSVVIAFISTSKSPKGFPA